jgi:hypothetical protein
MQPNYEEMMKRQQQDYQRSRDPFQYGQQVAQRRYSEIMSNLDSQRQATQQSYGDLYSQARQRAVRGQAMGGPTLSGGMGQQQKDYVSAIEMQELGRIGQAREGASRDLYSQGQAAFSNAQLEGQQATQMEVQNRQTQLQLVQQRQAILDSDLPEEQKQAQLAALEGTAAAEGIQLPSRQTTPGQAIGSVAVTGSVIGGTIAAKVGAKQLATATAQVGAKAVQNELKKQIFKEATKGTSQAAKKLLAKGSAAYFKTSKGAEILATKTAEAVSAKLGWTGKLAQKVAGKGFAKTAFTISKGVVGKVGGFFLKKVLPVWLIASTVETIAEALGVADGRGFSGLLTKEGSWADKAFETLGL